MAKAQVPFFALNVGEVDTRALARTDLEKMRLASESMINFVPTVLGPVQMRPGSKYVAQTYNNLKAKLIPFVFNSATTALIEVTSAGMRVFNSGTSITYPAVSTTISALTSWTSSSTGNGSIATSGSALLLNSDKYSYGRARTSFSVNTTDRTKLHCLRVVVTFGPVIFRLGTAAGNGDIISSQTLSEGTHYIAFTPNVATVWADLEAIEPAGAQRRVESVSIIQNQEMLIPTPWAEADLPRIRYAQSGSVIFVACSGYQQYRIERRGTNSWGITKYYTSAGPYVLASSRREQLKTSALYGNVTLTCNENFFSSGHVGSLFELTHPKQKVQITFSGSDQYSDWIRVTGVGTGDRLFKFTIYNPGSTTLAVALNTTVSLERAYGTPDGWTEVTNYTVTSSVSYDDSITSSTQPGSNNQIVYYRLSIRPGVTYTATTISGTLIYEGGAKVGIVRVTGYTNATTVSAEVISPLGDTNFTSDWREGAWSNRQSWPSSVVFHDGRLWWAGLDKVYGSVSDDYANFDPLYEGDAGPIVRSIATGPVEGIVWMLSLQRLLVGTASAEMSIRSSSFDEPLTPTQFTSRRASTYGCGDLQALPIDSGGIFVQRNLQKVLELRYDVDVNDYAPSELTRLNQSICSPGVTDLCVQRQPDTRVWFVKSDGTLAMLLYDRRDNVVGWARTQTDGAYEAIAPLPSTNDDDIYVVVNRTINGVTRRYIEVFAQEDEIIGGADNWSADASVKWTSGSATTAVTGLTHLAGKQVIVWSNGAALVDQSSMLTVSSTGTLTLPAARTSAIIGLPFTGKIKTVKLAYGSQAGTALTQRKRVDHLALLATRLCPDGIKIGRDFTTMTKISQIYKGKQITTGACLTDVDYDATTFNGSWDTDSRVCIQNQAPYPVTITGFVINMESNDRG